MKTPSFIKNAIYSALIFFGTLLVLSAGYAAFTTLQSSDAGPGKSLTSTMMQTVIGNLSDLDSRVTGISSTVSALQVSAGNLWNTSGWNISYTWGNVGIGTATPGALVHVYKDSGNNAEIDIQSTAGANKHWAVYNDRTNNSLKFWNNDAAVEKNILTLGNTGNVGIGTVSPNAKLHVVGNTIVEGTISTLRSATDYNAISLTNSGGVQVHLNANGNAEWNLRTVTNHPLSFSTNNIPRMTISASGYVGIGVTNPTIPLQMVADTTATAVWGSYGIAESFRVNPASVSSASSVGAHFDATYNSSANLAGGVIIGSEWIANHTTAATVSNSVGVQGMSYNSSVGTVTNAVWVIGYAYNVTTGTITSAIGLDGIVVNKSTGNIGTSYEAYLSTDNNGTITNQYGLYQATPASKNYFAGNVGIGTTAPGQKLSVAGTIESTSGGYKFPDGTTQTTAAVWGGNIFGGMYSQYMGARGAVCGQWSNHSFTNVVNPITGAYSCPSGFTNTTILSLNYCEANVGSVGFDIHMCWK